jgi:cytochrome P450
MLKVTFVGFSGNSRTIEVPEGWEYFSQLWNERVNAPHRTDLISKLAHGPTTRNLGAAEFMGNLVLLIVGGNDTTPCRSSATSTSGDSTSS